MQYAHYLEFSYHVGEIEINLHYYFNLFVKESIDEKNSSVTLSKMELLCNIEIGD